MPTFKQFESIRQHIQAGKAPGLNIVFALFLGFVALVVIVFLMLQASRTDASKEESSKTTSSEQSLQMSQIFQDNEKRINALQSETQTLLKQIPLSSKSVALDSDARLAEKHWRDRQLASTEVYGDRTPTNPSSLKNSEALHLSHPESTIAQGEWISAVLETSINSELPGMVRAQVTEPVYSYQGQHVLIPRGSRLVGQYLSARGNGGASKRVFILWNRVLTPSGSFFNLDSPGVDDLGRSGMNADEVESHFLQIFGQATLLSIIGGGVSMAGVSDNEQPNSRDQWRQSIGENFQNSAAQSLSTTRDISPTLHVRQGALVKVFVAKDLSC
jgi:type IV secretory pathway VirB10-like protein